MIASKQEEFVILLNIRMHGFTDQKALQVFESL